MTRTAFLDSIRAAAQGLGNVNPDGAAAHAALESAWGESGLAVQGNNLWGVKATGSWQGDTIDFLTREFLNGRWVTMRAAFRKYPSLEACLADYDGILSRVYPATAANKGNLVDWLACLWLRGPSKWSTDPLIYPKVLNIATQYGLLGAPAPPPVRDGSVEVLVLNRATLADKLGVLFGGDAIPLRGGWRWRASPDGRKLDVAR